MFVDIEEVPSVIENLKLESLDTFLVPSNLQGLISGVRIIRIGVEVVHVELLDTAWQIPRSLLPNVLPTDYSDLADLVRPLASRKGIEVDSIL